MIGFAVTGSFCNFASAFGVLEEMKARFGEVLPIFSYNASSLDTRFGKAREHIARAQEITGRKAVLTLQEAEPLGPKVKLEALVICPCTGNTLAKLAHGIYDTPVTLAAKAHLRTGRPLIVALATNDALAGNFENLAAMAKRKHVYFVPLCEDDPVGKPYSLVCDFSRVAETAAKAMAGEEVRPFFGG